jgi:glycosyltransferase involved in cell wall biosynthesis
VANSNFVANRIRTAWGREASTVYPPVRTDFYSPGDNERRDYFAVVGAQVGYKNTALAVEAATQNAFKLKVVGAGPAIEALKNKAGSTVSFVGHVSDDQLRKVYREARGLLFCGVEDFGIVPVEAISCGCPVVAFAEGGALETVRTFNAAPMGVLFPEQSVSSLVRALKQLDAFWQENTFEPDAMHSYAQSFSPEAFEQRMRSEIDEALGLRAS